MAKTASSPTRVASDVASGASVTPTANRTVTEQINYWARIGMQVERSGSLVTRRLLAVAAGEAQFATLDPDERVAAHAVIDAQIAERVAQQRFGHEAEQAYEAANIATAACSTLIDARLDFCAETVFSHQSKVDLVTTAVAAGYDMHDHSHPSGWHLTRSVGR